MILAYLSPPSMVGLLNLGVLVMVLVVLVANYWQKRREVKDTAELLRIAKEWVRKGERTLTEVKATATEMTGTAAEVKAVAAEVKDAVTRDPSARTRAGDSDHGTTKTPPLPDYDPATHHPNWRS